MIFGFVMIYAESDNGNYYFWRKAVFVIHLENCIVTFKALNFSILGIIVFP